MIADFPPAVQAEVRRILDRAARRVLDGGESQHDEPATASEGRPETFIHQKTERLEGRQTVRERLEFAVEHDLEAAA